MSREHGYTSFERKVVAIGHFIAQAAFVATLATSATSVDAAVGDCGLPLSSTNPSATDCLFVLRAAVHLESCVLCTCDVDDGGEVLASDALLCLRFAVGQNVTLSCPPCLQCPEVVEWTTHGGIGQPCAANADCPLEACDTVIGRCRTASELDLGWTGRSHDVDLNDGSALRLFVECDGLGQTCGSCEIEGLDPSLGNCRCANDTRVTCDSPFVADPACPACSGGAFAGVSCGDDAQCDGGQCAKFCAFDAEIACTTNADCPFGRRLCPDELSCGDGLGSVCAVQSDCIGTCTASAVCECFESPPQPVASVDFPLCIVTRLAGDVSGTVDVDSGASELVKDLQLRAFGGVSLPMPCPVCGGKCSGSQEPCALSDDCSQGESCSADPVAGDGIREGTCFGGGNQGLSCDVSATNASFPPGGGYSLDCMPEVDSNFTGTGLRGRAVERTGTSSLPAQLDCDGDSPGLQLCPCLVCSGGSETACSSDEECEPFRSCSGLLEQGCETNGDCEDIDLGTCTSFGATRCTGSIFAQCLTNADCAAVDFGSCEPSACSSVGEGADAQPNDCNVGVCTDDGGGEGTCDSGPDDNFCDGLLTADGSGIRRCFSNVDCSVEEIGFDAGACTIVERRACFLDPIVAQGTADPLHPIAAAAFCVSPTTSAGANASLGLPGPARVQRQTTMQSIQAE